MDKMKTGLFIQTLRKERKLTQQELADLLLVTNKAISRWETGEGFPDVFILPRLGEVLGVSVDEILAGTYLKKKETKILSESHKFLNTLLMTKVVMFLSFVLFLGLTYSTYKVWIGFLGYVIPATVILTWLIISRNNYMQACIYDEDDRLMLFRSLKESVTLYGLFFSMTLPQMIAIANAGLWNNGVLEMGLYVLTSIFFGLFTYLGISVYFYYGFEHGKYKHLLPKLFNKIVMYTIVLVIAVLVLMMNADFESINMSLTLVIVVMISLLNISLMIYFKIKELASIKHIMVTLLFSLIMLIFAEFSRDGFIRILFIISYFLLLAWFLIVSVLKIRKKQIDAWFYVFFQNLFLYIFALFFSVYPIYAFILIYGSYILLDAFLIDKYRIKYLKKLKTEVIKDET